MYHNGAMPVHLESFFQRGSNFDNVFFFLVNKGIEDPKSAINGPSSARLAKRH